MNQSQPLNVTTSEPLGPRTAASPVVKLPARGSASAAKAVEVSDEALFSQSQGGNKDALGTLVGRYEKPLYSLLARMTGDSHRAEDLFQETFLHAMRAAASFKTGQKFKPWITAIAVNLVRDDGRKRKVRGEVALDAGGDEDESRPAPIAVDTGATPGEAAETNDRNAAVQQALQRLTEVEREVVLLHFYSGMTLVEAAESLKIPVGTAKSRLHAALTRLSGILSKVGL